MSIIEGYSLRPVSSGCQAPTSISATFKQFNSRSRHKMLVDVSAVKIDLSGFKIGPPPSTLVTANTAAGVPINATVTCAIEYPSGTFTQVKFGGSASGSLVSGQNLISDFAAVTIPAGAFYYVRVFWISSQGLCFSVGNAVGLPNDTVNGEGFNYAASGLTDLTLGGTITNTDSVTMFRPLAVLASSTLPVVGIFGDSRAIGLDDGYGNQSTAPGEIARGVMQHFPYMLCASSGGTLQGFLNYSATMGGNAVSMFNGMQYCTHIIVQYGINDLFAASQTGVQVAANLQQFAKLFRGRKVFNTTKSPETTSTDLWATSVNQTTGAANAERVILNNLIRAGMTGFQGYFEIADLTETARDSGIWISNGTANFYTDDGVHESKAMNDLIVTADIFNTTAIN